MDVVPLPRRIPGVSGGAARSGPGGRRPPGYRRFSLYTRVLIVNASILACAIAAIALTPFTIPFPVGVEEALVLVVLLGVMVIANAILLRASFGPLSRLVRRMETTDLLRPDERLPITGGVEVRTLVRAFNDMLERLESERRESTKRVLDALESERRRIGQELHDEIGQRLTGILLELKPVLEDATPDIRANLLAAQDDTRRTLDEVGKLAWQLRPGILDDLGLVRALEALVETVEDHTAPGVVRASLTQALPELDQGVDVAIYRIAQEALTNTLRHAGARRIEMSLAATSSAVFLRVADDGCGIPRSEREGAGIYGMRERAFLVHGRLEINSTPGRGVEVTLEVPVRAGEGDS
jgi:two-component system sensor histidine kinase UhpB